MNNKLLVKSPIDNSVVVERIFSTLLDCKHSVTRARKAQRHWAQVPISERAIICHKAIDYLIEHIISLAEEITWQMGRPIKYAAGELRGVEERARHMITLAEQALTDVDLSNETTRRLIKRVPLGLVLTIVPWNYPYLTAINSIIPAIMAGNSVLLKHSVQTPLCAEALQRAFEQAGLPKGVFQYLCLDHEKTEALVKNPAINFIAFTGSYSAGMHIEKIISGRNKGLSLELGGKDPAYVRQDAEQDYTIDNLVDGVFFNSGQSCCAIERIYVHDKCYEQFVDKFIEKVYQYKFGTPLDSSTTLGPMVNYTSAARVRGQIKQACAAGARAHIDALKFSHEDSGSYLPPQVLTGVDHTMAIMQEETFGPVVGIMRVKSDADAVALMNDSRYGLTASIWTEDLEQAEALGNKLDTGTVFLNRCDYLDPALAWTGIKDSGRGCALSSLGYMQLTRAKSFHLKHTH